MRFGVQLYGLSGALRADMEGTLRALARAGYRAVEPCVALGELGGFERVIWNADTLAAAWPLMQKYGLEMPSCHVFSRDLYADIPRLWALSARYGVRDFVTKCPDALDTASCRAFAAQCARIAEGLAQRGARLLLHNEYNEIVTRVAGVSAYEWIVAHGGGVGMQPDVGWLRYAGENPEDFLWRNKEQVFSLHYKDVRGALGACPPAACCVKLGAGLVDALACFQFARARGIPQVVDQDRSEGNLLSDIADTFPLLDGFKHRRDNTGSELCVLDTVTGAVTPLRAFPGIIEAPNWPEENTLLYNAEGAMYRYTLSTGERARIDTGACDRCNNDHAPSWDGRFLAVSHADKGSYLSRIYTLPMDGGAATCVTPNAPSFLHGWSPDGRTLAYCAFRKIAGETKVDIYTIPAAGGEETRLTDGMGYNDGAEYAPDGEHIWYCSTREGLMQAYRMRADGTENTRMSREEANVWFPHVSPDGEKVLMIAYRKGDLDPAEHLPNLRVTLLLMPAQGGEARPLVEFFGGQDSCNVHSWAPDSRRIAFVRYVLRDAHGNAVQPL